MFVIFQDLKNIGGGGLLDHFNNSPFILISNVYPEYEWLPWRFNQVPKGYWDDMKNQRNFMDWAGKQLNYTNREDWYKVTIKVKFQNISS